MRGNPKQVVAINEKLKVFGFHSMKCKDKDRERQRQNWVEASSFVTDGINT